MSKQSSSRRLPASRNEIVSDSQTNLQFKLLSAIGIIIIVSGHCYHGGISLAYEWFPTYSFNLALFVFISGYFYKPENERSKYIYIYIWKRFKRLILPALLWNVAYGLFILLTRHFDYTIGAEVTPYNLFLMPFVDGEAFRYNLGSWFVYPLFLVCIFNILFRKLSGLLRIKNEYVFAVIYLAIGMLGIQLALDGHSAGIMKLVTRAMFFLPCFQFGRLYRSRWEKKDNLNSIAYFSILFGIQLLLLTFCEKLEYYPSSMTGFQNGVVIPYLSALLGIAFWLRIAKLLAPHIKNWRFFRLIADNTYSIMIHQMLGFMSVKWLFYGLSLITNCFPDFSVDLMRSNIWYYYLPNGLQRYGLLYLAGGLFLPIAIKKVCDLVCKAGQTLRARITKTH